MTLDRKNFSRKLETYMLPICVQTIFVSDLERAIRFYSDGLGYEVKARYGPCIAQLKTGSTTLILEQIEGLHPEAPTTVLSFQTTDRASKMSGRCCGEVPRPLRCTA